MQTDRKDDSAGTFDDMEGVSSSYQKTRASSGMPPLGTSFHKQVQCFNPESPKQKLQQATF